VETLIKDLGFPIGMVIICIGYIYFLHRIYGKQIKAIIASHDKERETWTTEKDNLVKEMSSQQEITQDLVKENNRVNRDMAGILSALNQSVNILIKK
jgi:Na+(H+)/acetate symporter ActP